MIKLETYKNRRNRLRILLRQRNLDTLLVSGAANRFYLSGFELHDGQCDETSGMLAITSHGKDLLFTDSRYELAAKAVWNPADICIYRSNPYAVIASALAGTGTIIGIDGKHMDYGFATRLIHALSDKCALLDGSGLVEKLRIIKEPDEISALEKSFELNHRCLEWLEKRLCQLPALSEKQLAWEIECFFREGGASELAFPTIVASGPAAAMPHARPRDVPIGENCPLLIDLGCRVDNYCSDQTRTWWLGENPPPEFSAAMRLVREAQNAALKITGPGVTGTEVYDAACSVFAKAGVEQHFTHGLGHGVGLQTHEAPSLNKSGQKLRKGMVVTIEPGLYYPQWGGIRWEHTVVIEENGCRIL